MQVQLSSILVPLFKLIPLVVLAYEIYRVLRDFRNLSDPGFYFILAWCGFWFLFAGRWKRVRLRGGMLQVSNYLRTIEIPVSEVEQVEASRFWGSRPQTVRLVLKTETSFGDLIVFVPRGASANAKRFADELRGRFGL